MKKNIKFLLILILFMGIGMIIGISASYFDIPKYIEKVFSNLQDILNKKSYIIFMSLTIGLSLIATITYFFGKKQTLKSLEDEDEITKDSLMSVSLTIISINIILPLVLMVTFAKNIRANDIANYKTILVLLIFIVNTGFMAFLENLIIRFLKSYNPNIYDNTLDMKFQKKYMESVDERELLQIYKASFKAYRNMSLVGYWLLIVLSIMIIGTKLSLVSLYAIFLVLVVGTISYTLEASKNK